MKNVKSHKHRFKTDGIERLKLPYRRGLDVVGSLRQACDRDTMTPDPTSSRKGISPDGKSVGVAGTNGRCIRGTGWIKCVLCNLRERCEFVWS